MAAEIEPVIRDIVKRLGFFKQLMGFGGGWLMVPFGSNAGSDATHAEPLDLYEGWVAGYTYHEGPAVEGALYPGKALQLKREPQNPHDGKAVAVYAGGNKLGYISRSDNKVLAKLMDQQAPVHAQVLKFKPNAPTWERVKICVGL